MKKKDITIQVDEVKYKVIKQKADLLGLRPSQYVRIWVYKILKDKNEVDL